MKRKYRNEFSAGGLVLKKIFKTASKNRLSAKALMVEVKNLQSQIVWTFPKGHLEKNETCEQSALREVKEETGWNCRIVQNGKRKFFQKVRYQFERDRCPVKKSVTWYLMVPISKSGAKDPEEIRRVRWFSIQTAMKKVRYPSDIKLLEKLSGCLHKMNLA